MNFIERHGLLARIAQFIRQEKTGSLREFAKKCDIKKTDYMIVLKFYGNLRDEMAQKFFMIEIKKLITLNGIANKI